MLGKFWTFVSRQLVGDVPDEMSACLDCSAVQCRDNRFETCPHRLAEATALRAMRASEGQPTMGCPGDKG